MYIFKERRAHLETAHWGIPNSTKKKRTPPMQRQKQQTKQNGRRRPHQKKEKRVDALYIYPKLNHHHVPAPHWRSRMF